ncbi:MAG: isopeptide-forming domain-containing fimbrial protein, partial [Microcella sp.]
VASIDPATGGGQTFVNTVSATGYTLPADLRVDAVDDRGDRVVTASETITAVRAALDKQVRIGDGDYAGSVSAPIGETVEYRVQTTLEASINYWRATLTDTLPAGVELDVDSIVGPSIDGVPAPGDWVFTQDGQELTWTYDSTTDGPNILSAPTERLLEVTYQVRVTDDVTTASLVNSAAFGWNLADDDDAPRTTVEDTATVTVVDPEVVIEKTVNGVSSLTAEVDAELSYSLTARNVGDTAAYAVVIVDDVPAGVAVTSASIVPEAFSVSPGALNGTGGQIEWRFAGPFDVNDTIELEYSAVFVDASALSDDATLQNVVVVESWESFPEDGRSYGPSDPAEAEVSPRFPDVQVAKSAGSTTVALAGQPFEWVLTVRNEGTGIAQTVEVTDTLPVNWVYTATSSVLIGGVPATADFSVTGDGTAGSLQQLVWSFGDSETAALAAGAQLEIRFTATPTEDALTDAGVTLADGTPVPHLNVVSIDATDARGERENDDREYAGLPADAEAFLHSADIVVEKTAAESITAGAGPGTGWTIEVSNDGPDPAVGPITLNDVTAALPEGVTVTSLSGSGWSCGVPERALDGVTTTECSHPGISGQLASGASLPPLTVTVEVAAGLDPALVPAGGIVNSASAESDTFDPDGSNNADDDALTIVFEADLAIVKTLATDEPTAGGPISWTIQPRNDGPSFSRADDDTPITITDTVPEGVVDVTVAVNPDWSATASAGFPASAGDEIVFQYTGDAMPLGATAPITLSGTIVSGWPDGDDIVNEATITPGLTPDPDEGNNTDDATTTPGTSTSLAVSKIRVVERDGSFVPAATADPEAPFVAGEQTAYRVVVTAIGPADARDVAVLDEAPVGFTYDSHINEVGTWSRTAVGDGDRFALGGDLVAGESASFIVVFDTASDIQGDVVNTVTATAENADEPVTDSDDTGTDRVADLSIVKTQSGDAIAGQSTSFTLTVTNEGPSDASLPITVADVLPSGLSFVPGSALVSVAGGTAVALAPSIEDVDGRDGLSWTIGSDGDSLPLGATIVVTFDVAIAAELPAQTIQNVAVVSGQEDPNPSNDDGEVDVPITTLADMSVLKSVSAGPWVAGTDVTYTITVTNAGPSVADARIVDVAPPGITVTGLSGAGWECDVETASCERDAHPVSSTTITVDATIDEAATPGSELVNVAELTWIDSRGSQEDEDEVPITVTALADLGVVKTAVDRASGVEVSTVAAGTVVRYLIDVTNYGPSVAEAPITVTDALPEGMAFLSATDPARWDCSADGADVTCVDAAGSLAVGQTVTLALDVMLDASATTGTLTNVASGSSVTPEPDDAVEPNTDDADVEVVQEAMLRITKSHDAGAVRVGERLTFTIQVSSDGPSDATEVVMTERIPAGLEFVGVASAGDRWSLVSETGDAETGTVVVLALDGTLTPGAAAPEVLVTVDVLPTAQGSVVNVVEVTATQQTGDPAVPPSDEDEVVVPPLSTLVVEKTAMVGAAGWMVGDEVAYEITVSNLGPTHTVNSVTVIDDMPAGLRPTGASTNAGPCVIEGQRVECELSDGVDVGETRTITVTAQLLAGAYPEIVNIVTIQTDTQLTTESIVEATAIATVAANPLPFTGIADGLMWVLLVAVVLALLGATLLVVRRRRALR